MKVTLNQPYSFCQLGGRDNQEDARFPDDDEPRDIKPFFVVCDGVGGEEKGEVASHTVCDAFAKSLARFDWTGDFTDKDFKRCLNVAYSELDRRSSQENKGMATTMTFMAFHAGGCTVAHIGDSRIYHVRPGIGILYRSDDHSLVNALVHSGAITPDEAIGHSKGNVITRCMEADNGGGERSGATVLRITDIRQGDYFVLCTDGVLHQVTDDRLVEILSDGGVPDKGKYGLLASMSEGSVDNNTLYMVSVKEVEAEEQVEEVYADTTDDDGMDTANGAGTAKLRRPGSTAREIAADADISLMDKIRNLMGRIF